MFFSPLRHKLIKLHDLASRNRKKSSLSFAIIGRTLCKCISGNLKNLVFQIRGSVPGHWTQDVSSMVPKPQIFFQLSDPFCRTSGKHFDGLMKKYGAPIIVLNLVSSYRYLMLGRWRHRTLCLLSEKVCLCPLGTAAVLTAAKASLQLTPLWGL